MRANPSAIAAENARGDLRRQVEMLEEDNKRLLHQVGCSYLSKEKKERSFGAHVDRRALKASMQPLPRLLAQCNLYPTHRLSAVAVRTLIVSDRKSPIGSIFQHKTRERVSAI